MHLYHISLTFFLLLLRVEWYEKGDDPDKKGNISEDPWTRTMGKELSLGTGGRQGWGEQQENVDNYN